MFESSGQLFAESAPFVVYSAQTAGAEGSGLFTFGFLALMILLFYFLLIRPQSKRRKEHAALIGSLATGDEGGLLGKITKVEDDYVRLQVTKNVEFRLQKHAINATLPQGTIKSLDQA